jgi:integrase
MIKFHYEEMFAIAGYRIVKHPSTHSCYLSWYDGEKRQTRRRSLKSQNIEYACALVRSLVERGIAGDPGKALDERPLRTVSELLDWHGNYVEALVSCEAEKNQIKRLKRLLGDRRISLLVPSEFEAFRDTCLTDEKISIGTISRTLSTLRRAVNRAADDRKIRRESAPHVPEFRTKNQIRSAPPKGRIMSLEELARLIDAIDHLHLLLFTIFTMNTACRPGAALDCATGQIDLLRGVVDLNPEGRLQTKKYRPTLPVTSTLRPWLLDLPPGRLITWNGKPIAEIDRAFAKACHRAELPGGEAAYSLRHMIGRHMRRQGVPLEQVSVWLGHVQPPMSSQTTLIYSPDSPDYLSDAKRAVEDFVHRLNALTRRDLLLPPWRK